VARPRVTVVGLGPAGPELLTRSTEALVRSAPNVVFRTRRHPAAEAFGTVESFDELYERVDSFEVLYGAIVDALVERASTEGELVYVVPGSPMVAERSVELLLEREGLDVVVLPALSFAELAWAALKVDPVHSGVRFVDATTLGARLRGPGPLLLTQCYRSSVLSAIKLSVDSELFEPRPRAVVLHHLGLEDEEVLELDLDELDGFEKVDHLTSVFIPELRSVGPAAEDLVDLMARLRAECPWDAKQTHESLTRHLLEESYETIEALERLHLAIEEGRGEDEAYDHVAEELGDLVFQVVFHAQLASEEGRFTMAELLDGVRSKLIGRHPHVFGEVVAETADQVASNWEAIKQVEKGRGSVTEGIPAGLPALSRYVKLRRKANAIGLAAPSLVALQAQLEALCAELSSWKGEAVDDAASTGIGPLAALVGALLQTGVELAQQMGVDAEAVLRQRAELLRAEIVDRERQSS
jgi:tetrapyrrole methylase family protein/MazG family protein